MDLTIPELPKKNEVWEPIYGQKPLIKIVTVQDGEVVYLTIPDDKFKIVPIEYFLYKYKLSSK